MKLLSRVRLLETPWTAAYKAALSMGTSRQENWNGVPLPSPLSSLTRDQTWATTVNAPSPKLWAPRELLRSWRQDSLTGWPWTTVQRSIGGRKNCRRLSLCFVSFFYFYLFPPPSSHCLEKIWLVLDVENVKLLEVHVIFSINMISREKMEAFHIWWLDRPGALWALPLTRPWTEWHAGLMRDRGSCYWTRLILPNTQEAKVLRH